MRRSVSLALAVCVFLTPRLFALCTSVDWTRTHVRDGSARALVSIDYDRDGKFDLASVSGKDLVLYRGNGDGSFGSPQIIHTHAATLGDLHTADMNGDGIGDLILNADRIAIFLGNGTGFAAPTFVSGIDPRRIQVGDFDGNGHPDVAGVSASGEFEMHLNSGGGNLAPGGQAAVGTAIDLAVADFDGDGRSDLAVTSGTALRVLYRNADGTFATPVVYADVPASTLAAGDFNRDGRADLILTRDGSDFEVFLDAGARTFTRSRFPAPPPYLTYGVSPWRFEPLVLRDIDGDQNVDIVLGQRLFLSIHMFSTFLGKGDGTFRTQTYLSAFHIQPSYGFVYHDPTAFAIADFDGDGKRDLVVAIVGIYAGAPTLETYTYACRTRVYLFNRIPVISAGQQARVDVAVAGISPTTPMPRGVVTIKAGQTAYNSREIDASGQASVVVDGLPAGSHHLTAALTGSSEVADGVSNWVPIRVTTDTTTTSLSVGSSTYGTPTTITITIRAPDGRAISGSSALEIDGAYPRPVAGTNQFLLNAGTHTATASYAGDYNYPPSTSAPVTFTTAKAATSITHTLGSLEVLAGSPHTLTFKVSGPGPTGTLQLEKGNTVLGSAALVDAVATIETTPLPAGTHDVQVIFAGDANLLASTLDLQLVVVTERRLAIEARAANIAGAAEILASMPDDTRSFQMNRRSIGGSWTAVPNWSPDNVTDTGLTPGAQYEYRLDIVRGNGTSQSSNIDPVQLFTDHPLAAGTFVKRAHFEELKAAVNLYRVAAGLSPFAFDATYDESPIVHASHINGLRTAANEARSALYMTPMSFTGAITAGITQIQALHIRELRQACR